jgi:hypothetical protein
MSGRPKRVQKTGTRDDISTGANSHVHRPHLKKVGRRPKRPKLILTRGGPPFDREFFEMTLVEMVRHCPCPDGCQPIVRLHLADGAQIDVAGMLALKERYGVAAAYEGKGQDGIEHTADDLGLEAFPYDIVVRATVRAEPKQARFGFGSVELPLEKPDPTT